MLTGTNGDPERQEHVALALLTDEARDKKMACNFESP
jgi:hypothetical protein